MRKDTIALLCQPQKESSSRQKTDQLSKSGLLLFPADNLHNKPFPSPDGLLMCRESDDAWIPAFLRDYRFRPILLLLYGENFSRGYADRLQAKYAEQAEVVRLFFLGSGEKAVIGGEASGRWVASLRRLLANHKVISLVCRLIEADEVAHQVPQFLAWKQRFYRDLAERCDQSAVRLQVVAQALGMDRRIGQGWLASASAEAEPDLLDWLVRETVAVSNRRYVRKIAVWGGSKVWEAVYLATKAELRIYVPTLSEKPNELYSFGQLPFAHGINERAGNDAAFAVELGEKPVFSHVGVCCASPLEALADADLLVIGGTDPLIQVFDLHRLTGSMRQPIVIDAGLCFPPEEAEEYGMIYRTYGQKTNVWEWN